MSETCSSFRLLLKNYYLLMLINIPDVAEKILMIDLQQLHSSISPQQKRTTSFTKNKCVREIVDAIQIPKINHNLLAFAMSKIRSSTIKRNKRGERGKPCLRPWITLKESDGVLLIRTTKFVDLKHPKIQLTVSNVKPTCNKISLNGVQLTLSQNFTIAHISCVLNLFTILLSCHSSQRWQDDP